jgi:MFS family permease
MATSAASMPDVRSLVAVIATAAIIGVGNSMQPPLLSIRLEEAGLSTGWNGLLAAMPSLAILVVGASFPIILKRNGPLLTFYASTALAILCLLIFPFSDNYSVWLLLRLVMGATLGLQWVISESWINSLAAGPRRGTILGLYVAVFSAGLAIGPLLLSLIGTTGYLSFLVCAGIYALCGLPLPLAQKMKELPEHQKPLPFATVLRQAPAENIGSFVNGATWGSLVALFPLYAMHLGRESGEALRFVAAMCVGSLICQPLIGRAIDRFSPRLVLLATGLAQILISAALAIAVVSDLGAWPLLLAWGASIGGIYTASLTGLGARFPEADLPAASTAFTMVWEAGALAGPLIIGMTMLGWDPHGLALVTGILGAILALACIRRGKIVVMAEEL